MGYFAIPWSSASQGPMYALQQLTAVSSISLTVRGLFMVLSCRAFRQVELMLTSSSCEVSYSTTTGVSFCWSASNVSMSRILPTTSVSKEACTAGWELNISRPGRQPGEEESERRKEKEGAHPSISQFITGSTTTTNNHSHPHSHL